MQLYKTLYHLLFNAITDALDALAAGNVMRAQALLIGAQRRAEDIWVQSEEEPEA